jgi:uncharacterized ParB-like nuclease family protein
MAENLASSYLPPSVPQGHRWTRTDLSVDAIRTMRLLQPREVPWDDKTVRAYADAMRQGDKFPPILVARVKGALYVADGFHRLAATHRAKRKTITALVAPMSEGEAFLVSIHANATHGLPLKPIDKRRILSRYVEEGLHRRGDGSVKSSRKIAEELRRMVSHTMVASFLREAQIEAGDAEDDGLPVGNPWRVSSPQGEENEMLEDATTHLHKLRTVCDQLTSKEALLAIRRELTPLLERLDQEIMEQQRLELEI